MEKTRHDWMDTAYVLTQIANRKRAARKAYRRFVAEGMAMGRIREFTGGGLIRSKGGWSQVLSARRKGRNEECDERILGNGKTIFKIVGSRVIILRVLHGARLLDTGILEGPGADKD